LKTLKNQQIGDGNAHLYHVWASLEHADGNVSKALGILAKGLKSGAQPARCAFPIVPCTSFLLLQLFAQFPAALPNYVFP
jgi:hypothetical protein